MSESAISCVVEFDYDAELADELTIRVGEVIKEVEMLGGGWWRGKLEDKVGMFPDNFVKVLPGTPPNQSSSSRAHSGNPVNNTATDDSEEVIMRNSAATNPRKRCRVLFSYSPAHEDELELQVDETIEFLGEVEDGWWKGKLNGKIGVFPSNFVEQVFTDAPMDNDLSNGHTEEPARLNGAADQDKQLKQANAGSNSTGGSNNNLSNNNNNVVEEKNKKNSLGLSNGGSSSYKSDLSLHHSLAPAENGSSLSSKVDNASLPHLAIPPTSSAQVIPDSAPRLPPKPDTSDFCVDSNVADSPVVLRRQVFKRRIRSMDMPVTVPISANLFDPEDEPSSMFDRTSTLTVRPQSTQAAFSYEVDRSGGGFYLLRTSDNVESERLLNGSQASLKSGSAHGQSLPRHAQLTTDKTKSATIGRKSSKLFSRLRHSFGSKAKLPKIFSKSRLSGDEASLATGTPVTSNLNNNNKSPSVKRRNSFANFLRRCSSVSNNVQAKYQIEIERSQTLEAGCSPPRCCEAHVMELASETQCLLSSSHLDQYGRRPVHHCLYPVGDRDDVDGRPGRDCINWALTRESGRFEPDQTWNSHSERSSCSDMTDPFNSAICDDGHILRSSIPEENESLDPEAVFGSVTFLSDDIFADMFSRNNNKNMNNHTQRHREVSPSTASNRSVADPTEVNRNNCLRASLPPSSGGPEGCRGMNPLAVRSHSCIVHDKQQLQRQQQQSPQYANCLADNPTAPRSDPTRRSRLSGQNVHDSLSRDPVTHHDLQKAAVSHITGSTSGSFSSMGSVRRRTGGGADFQPHDINLNGGRVRNPIPTNPRCRHWRPPEGVRRMQNDFPVTEI